MSKANANVVPVGGMPMWLDGVLDSMCRFATCGFTAFFKPVGPMKATVYCVFDQEGGRVLDSDEDWGIYLTEYDYHSGGNGVSNYFVSQMSDDDSEMDVFVSKANITLCDPDEGVFGDIGFEEPHGEGWIIRIRAGAAINAAFKGPFVAVTQDEPVIDDRGFPLKVDGAVLFGAYTVPKTP